MRILVVKLSSLGDAIHVLPAIHDVAGAFPGVQIDWLIEPGFQEIAAWHPAVATVIPIPLRQWRKQGWLRNLISGGVYQVVKALRKSRYDYVVDAQGLVKSALCARVARAKVRVGFDATTAREAAAARLYHRKVTIAQPMHVIERLRSLFAQGLGYPVPITAAQYGVNWQQFPDFAPAASGCPTAVFLHGTTWTTKHWPDNYWLALAQMVVASGFEVQVTWATPEQKRRAQMLKDKVPGVNMLPHLTINQAVAVIRRAQFTVAVDTGFGHLAAALGIPSVSLYGPTNPALIGAHGASQWHLAGKLECAPCVRRKCLLEPQGTSAQAWPPCLVQITPQEVWQLVQQQILAVPEEAAPASSEVHELAPNDSF